MTDYTRSVLIKALLTKPLNVLEQNCSRIDLLNEPECFREQVPFIVCAKLLSSDRKGWAGNPAGEQVNLSRPLTAVQVRNIHFHDRPRPVRTRNLTVETQCLRRPVVYLNDGDMGKTGSLKAQCLATGTGTDLDGCQLQGISHST